MTTQLSEEALDSPRLLLWRCFYPASGQASELDAVIERAFERSEQSCRWLIAQCALRTRDQFGSDLTVVDFMVDEH